MINVLKINCGLLPTCLYVFLTAPSSVIPVLFVPHTCLYVFLTAPSSVIPILFVPHTCLCVFPTATDRSEGDA